MLLLLLLLGAAVERDRIAEIVTDKAYDSVATQFWRDSSTLFMVDTRARALCCSCRLTVWH